MQSRARTIWLIAGAAVAGIWGLSQGIAFADRNDETHIQSVKFAPDGKLLFSWGEPGSGPGQFHIPHGIAVDRAGTVYVADREYRAPDVVMPRVLSILDPVRSTKSDAMSEIAALGGPPYERQTRFGTDGRQRAGRNR